MDFANVRNENIMGSSNHIDKTTKLEIRVPIWPTVT